MFTPVARVDGQKQCALWTPNLEAKHACELINELARSRTYSLEKLSYIYYIIIIKRTRLSDYWLTRRKKSDGRNDRAIDLPSCLIEMTNNACKQSKRSGR
jgi:hypothetical protein